MMALVFDTILLVLTLVGSWRHFRSLGIQLQGRSIMYIVLRDGFWAYFCILREYHLSQYASYS